MNDQSTEEAIVKLGLTAPRVTAAQIDEMMKSISYVTVVPAGSTSTFVHAYYKKRFFLASGHSACVSPENFNEEIGRKIALAKAMDAARDKLWELEGWALFRSQE
jgi:hypothetical protein